VFAAAPPAYVVALLIQLLWIPLRLLSLAGWDVFEEHDTAVTTALNFVATALLVSASWELVRRGRGRVRAAMVVTYVMNVGSFAIQAYAFATMFGSRSGDWLVVLSWVWPISAVVAIVGLAIAAGTRSLGSSIVALLLSLALYEVPPVSRLLVGLGAALFWVFAVCVTLRNFVLIKVVAAIAKQCYEPTRDPVRASRGFRWLAWVFAARAAFAVVIIAIGTSTLITQIWLIGIQVVLLGAFAYLAWGIAQTQLPQLPRYSMFFAVTSVLFAMFVLGQGPVTIIGFGHVNWYESGDVIEPSWWQLVPAMLGVAWVVMTLGRYAKRARSIKTSVAIGGAVFTATTCYALLVRGLTDAWVCAAVGSVAMIPALRATAKALAAEPVQTTADVFA
jgi:hypothetical protein